MIEMSLRESKRRATARALARAAFDLARERGVDGFTIDEVVVRAGYSRRTFANHYSSKEEAIVAVAAERVRHGLDTGPEDNRPLVDWLHAVARTQLSHGLLNVLRELRALAEQHPALRPHLLDVQRLIRETALEATLARPGGQENPVHAHLLVGAAYGALTCVLEGRIPIRTDATPPQAGGPQDAEGAMTLEAFLNLTFTYLKQGF